MKSPDGNYWKTVADESAISSTELIEHFTVKYAFAPVHPKMRIGLTDVERPMEDLLDALCQAVICSGDDGGYEGLTGLKLDIYMTTNTEIKKRVRSAEDIDSETHHKILAYCMPRYVWAVEIDDESGWLAEFFVDATGIAQDIDVFAMIFRNQTARDLLKIASTALFKENNPYARKILSEQT